MSVLFVYRHVYLGLCHKGLNRCVILYIYIYALCLNSIKLHFDIIADFRRYEILKISSSLSQTYRHDFDVREGLQKQYKY